MRVGMAAAPNHNGRMEELQLTPASQALLQKGFLRAQANSELTKAKTDAWIGSFGTMAGILTGVAGSHA